MVFSRIWICSVVCALVVQTTCPVFAQNSDNMRKTIENEAAELDQMINSFANKIAQVRVPLEKKIQDLSDKLQERDSVIRDLKTDLTSSNKDLESKINEVKSLKNSLKENEESLDELKKKLDHKTAQLEDARKDFVAIEKEFTAAVAQAQQAEGALNRSKEKSLELGGMLAESNQHNEILLKKLSDTEQEADRTSSLDEEVEILKSRLKTAQEESGRLKIELSNREKAVRDSETAVVRLSGELEDSAGVVAELKKRLAFSNSELEKLYQKKSEQEKDVASLQKLNEKLKKDLESIKKEREEYVEKAEIESQELKARYNSEEQELKQEIDQRQAKIQDLKANVSELEKTLSEKENALRALAVQNEKDVQGVQQDNDREIKIISSQKDAVEKELVRSQKSLLKSTKELADSQEKRRQLQEKIEELSAQNTELQSIFSRLDAKYSKTQELYEQEKQNNNELKQQLESVSAELENTSQDNAQLIKELKAIEDEINSIHGPMEQKIEGLLKQIENKDAALKILQEEFVVLEGANKTALDAGRGKDAQIKAAESDLARLRADYDAVKNKEAELVASRNEALARVRNIEAEKKDQRQQLQKEIKQKQKDMEAAERNLQSAIEELKKSSDMEQNRLARDIARLQKELENVQGQKIAILDENRNQKEKYEAEITALKEKITANEKTISAFELSLQENKQQMDSLDKLLKKEKDTKEMVGVKGQTKLNRTVDILNMEKDEIVQQRQLLVQENEELKNTLVQVRDAYGLLEESIEEQVDKARRPLLEQLEELSAELADTKSELEKVLNNMRRASDGQQKDLLKDIVRLEKDLSAANDQKKIFKAEINDLKEKLENNRKKINALETQLNTAEKKAEQIVKELEAVRADNSMSEEKLELKHKHQIDLLMTEKEDIISQRKALIEENEQLRETLTQVRGAYEALELSIEKRIEQARRPLLEKLKELSSKLGYTEKDTERLMQDTKQSADGELKRLVREVVKLEKELKASQIMREQILEKSNVERTDLELSIKGLKDKLAENNSYINELKDQLAKSEKKISVLEASIGKSMDAQALIKDKDAAKADRMLRELTEQKDSIQIQYEEVVKENLVYRDALKELGEKYAVLEASLNKQIEDVQIPLQKKLTELSIQLAQFKNTGRIDVDAYIKKIKEKTDELAVVLQENRELNKQIKTLQKDLELSNKEAQQSIKRLESDWSRKTDQLHDQLKESIKETKVLSERLESLKREKKEIEEKYTQLAAVSKNDSSKELETLSLALMEKEASISTLTDKIEEYKVRQEELQLEIRQLSAALDQERKSREDTASSLKSLQTDLKNDIETLRKNSIREKEQLEKELNKEIAAKQAIITKNEKLIEDLRGQIAQLQEKNRLIHKESIEAANTRKKLEELQGSLTEYQKENESLRNGLRHLSEAYTALDAALAQKIQELNDSAGARLELVVREMKALIKSGSLSNQDLMAKIEKTAQELERAQEQNRIYAGQIESLESQIRALKDNAALIELEKKLSSVSRDLARAEESGKRYESKLEAQRGRASELSSRVKTLEKERDDLGRELQNVLAGQEKQLSALRRELDEKLMLSQKEAEKNISTVRKEYESVIKEKMVLVDRQTAEIRSLEKRLAESEDALGTARIDLHKQKEQNEELENNLKSANEDLSRLAAAIQTKDMEFDRLLAEKTKESLAGAEKIEKELAGLRKEYEALQKDKDDLVAGSTDRINSLSAINDKARAEIKDLTSALKSAQRELAALSNKQAAAETRIRKEFEKDISNLNEIILKHEKSIAILTARLEEVQDKARQRSDAVKTLVQERSQLKEQISLNEKKITMLEKDAMAARNSISPEVREQMDQLTRERRELIRRVKESELKITELEKDNSSYVQQNRDNQAVMSVVKEEKNELLEQIKDLRNSVDNLEKQLAEKENGPSKESKYTARFESEKEKLIARIREKESRIRDLEELMTSEGSLAEKLDKKAKLADILKEKVSSITRERNDYKARLIAKESELKKVAQNIAGPTDPVPAVDQSDSNIKLANVAREHKELIKELRLKQKELAMAQEDTQAVEKKYQQLRAELDEERLRADKALSELKLSSQQKIDTLNKRLKESTEGAEALSKEFAEYREKMSDTELTIDSLNKKLTALQKKYDDLRINLPESLKKEKADLNEQIKNLKDDLRSSAQRKLQAEKDLKYLERQLSGREKELQQAQADIQTRDEELAKIKEEVLLSKKLHAQAQTDVRDLERKLAQNEKDVKGAREEMLSHKERVEKLKEELQDARGENKTLEKKIADLQAQLAGHAPEIERMKSDLAQSKGDNEALQALYKKDTDELYILLEEAQTELAGNGDKLLLIEEELAQKTLELTVLEDEVSLLNAEKDKTNRLLEDALKGKEQLEAENTALEASLAEAEREKAKIQSRFDGINSALDKKQQELEEARANEKRALALKGAMENERNEMEKTLSKNTKMYTEKTQEFNELREKYGIVTKEFDQYKEDKVRALAVAQKEIEQLQESLRELKKQMAKQETMASSAEVEELRVRLHRRDKELVDMEERYAALKRTMDDMKTGSSRELQKKLAEKEKELAELEFDFAQLREDLKRALKIAEDENRRLKSELNSLRSSSSPSNTSTVSTFNYYSSDGSGTGSSGDGTSFIPDADKSVVERTVYTSSKDKNALNLLQAENKALAMELNTLKEKIERGYFGDKSSAFSSKSTVSSMSSSGGRTSDLEKMLRDKELRIVELEERLRMLSSSSQTTTVYDDAQLEYYRGLIATTERALESIKQSYLTGVETQPSR